MEKPFPSIESRMRAYSRLLASCAGIVELLRYLNDFYPNDPPLVRSKTALDDCRLVFLCYRALRSVVGD